MADHDLDLGAALDRLARSAGDDSRPAPAQHVRMLGTRRHRRRVAATSVTAALAVVLAGGVALGADRDGAPTDTHQFATQSPSASPSASGSASPSASPTADPRALTAAMLLAAEDLPPGGPPGYRWTAQQTLLSPQDDVLPVLKGLPCALGTPVMSSSPAPRATRVFGTPDGGITTFTEVVQRFPAVSGATAALEGIAERLATCDGMTDGGSTYASQLLSQEPDAVSAHIARTDAQDETTYNVFLQRTGSTVVALLAAGHGEQPQPDQVAAVMPVALERLGAGGAPEFTTAPSIAPTTKPDVTSTPPPRASAAQLDAALLAPADMPAWNGAVAWRQASLSGSGAGRSVCQVDVLKTLGVTDTATRSYVSDSSLVGSDSIYVFADDAGATAALEAYTGALKACAGDGVTAAASTRLGTPSGGAGSTWYASGVQTATGDGLHQFVGIGTAGRALVVVEFSLTGQDANYTSDPVLPALEQALPAARSALA